MRDLTFGVAAFLAIVMVVPAHAFEFDSTGGSAPGAAAQYADPFGGYDKQAGAKDEESEAPNGLKTLNGLQLSISGGGKSSSSVNAGAMGWMSPQPGRLTH